MMARSFTPIVCNHERRDLTPNDPEYYVVTYDIPYDTALAYLNELKGFHQRGSGFFVPPGVVNPPEG